jgi:hypothetical protein
MRKLVVCNIMSLDGCYTGPGGDVMVLPMDGAFDAYNAERLRAADTLLARRASYDGFRGFQPPLADDPDASPTHRETSCLLNAIDKVVVSNSITPEQTESRGSHCLPGRDRVQKVYLGPKIGSWSGISLPASSPPPPMDLVGSLSDWGRG